MVVVMMAHCFRRPVIRVLEPKGMLRGGGDRGRVRGKQRDGDSQI